MRRKLTTLAFAALLPLALPAAIASAQQPGERDCTVQVFLTKITYTGDDIGDDWSFSFRSVQHQSTSFSMTLGPGTHTFDPPQPIALLIFKDQKGQQVSFPLVIHAEEDDGPFDDTKTVRFTLGGFCPSTKEDEVRGLIVHEVGPLEIFTRDTAFLNFHFKVILDP